MSGTKNQAGRHQSKQRPVETKMLAKIRRFFAEIPANCADFCKFPQISAIIKQCLRNLVDNCRSLRNLRGFPRNICQILQARLFRLVLVSTGGVLLGTCVTLAAVTMVSPAYVGLQLFDQIFDKCLIPSSTM